MLKIFDDRNRQLYFARPPQRVVSLVPSDTETLFALGCGDRLVGRTAYCVEPAGTVAAAPTCGGTKSVDVDAVAALAPELVLANQEENARPQLEKLIELRIPVFISFPRRVMDGIAHLARLARILGAERNPGVAELVRRGYQAVNEAAARTVNPVPVFAPIWLDPLMTFGADTFGDDMLRLAGARNVFDDRERRYPLAADVGAADPIDPGARDTRYPRITRAEVESRAPRLILLPDEPHPFGEADRATFQAYDIPADVELCDGKDLFWYGARSIDAIGRLSALIDRHRE